MMSAAFFWPNVSGGPRGEASKCVSIVIEAHNVATKQASCLTGHPRLTHRSHSLRCPPKRWEYGTREAGQVN